MDSMDQPPPPEKRWKPPSDDGFKLNVDVALINNRWRNGVVVCNKEGDVVSVASLSCEHELGVDFAVAMVVYQGVKLALVHGNFKLQVEFDSQKVIRAVNNQARHNSYL